MNFKMNDFQQQVFTAIREFNPIASFEYAEWLKSKTPPNQILDVSGSLKAEIIKPSRPILGIPPKKVDTSIGLAVPASIPTNCFMHKVKVRMMQNGRDIAIGTAKEYQYLIVDLEEQALTRQIDEVLLQFNKEQQNWATAVVTKACGRSLTYPYPTIAGFLKRADSKRKRKHGFAQSQPLNFSKAVY